MMSKPVALAYICGALCVGKRVEAARLNSGASTGNSVGSCPPRAALPAAPTTALQYNGVSWPAYCFEGDEDEHLFILGDWGGLVQGGTVVPAQNEGPSWKGRLFQSGIDNKAQILVAKQMEKYAATLKPRLVLTGGDNFYWGGITEQCGKTMEQAIADFANPGAKATLQIKHVFEDMYAGTLADVPFLMCFGNHDYGGYEFHAAWDQQIAYTWSTATKRWILPGQYYHQRLNYPTKGMTVDVLMVDTCNQDTTTPSDDPGHNICSSEHNGHVSCEAAGGPKNAYDCVDWFKAMWRKEVTWMEGVLCSSDADWKIIVTHFPPEDNTHQPAVWDWKNLNTKCGIDFYVGSHRHDQELHTGSWGGFPYVVAGGGGGVTSEKNPGDNTQYGFFDLLVEKTQLTITSYNQDGRKTGGMNIAKKVNATNAVWYTAGDPPAHQDYRRRRSWDSRRRWR